MKDAEATKERLLGLAETLYDQFQKGIVPHLALPSRTKSNLEYDQEGEIWVYGDQESVRSVKTVRGAKSVLKTAYLVELLIKEHLLQNRGSTLREIYYISENW
ncbi:MAG TPA: DNA topoisomerase VI, partial [Methanothrix sp.]|nr:DNA topoisomerase VI [Methanothrix sp.]